MSQPSKEACLVMIQALAAQYLDQGSGNAAFVLYDSDDALLVTMNLPKPSTKSVTENHIELHATNVGTVIKAGVAVSAKLFNADGAAVMDVTVGNDASIVLDNYDLVLGSSVKLDVIYLSPLV